MFLFINMLQSVRIGILLAMVVLVVPTSLGLQYSLPSKKSATLGSLGDPENPEMKRFSVWSDLDIILTNFIVRAAWGWARMMLASMLTRANMAACRLHCRANPSDEARAGRAWWWGSRILASWGVWSLGVQTWAVGPIVGLLDLIHGLPTQTSSCRRGFLAAEGVQEWKRAAPFASASAQVKLYSYVVVTCPSETDSFGYRFFFAVGRHVSKPFSCACRSSSQLWQAWRTPRANLWCHGTSDHPR